MYKMITQKKSVFTTSITKVSRVISSITLFLAMSHGQSFAQTPDKELAMEILNSCVVTYAEVGSCNADNWANIQKICNINLHPSLQNSVTLKDGVANGQCTAAGFDAFSKAVIDEIYPN